ncbi:MAG: aldehyde ferredoxin oxidoreductase N-terminal domain-containing protein [Spirochaetota bacterium]
MSTSLKILLVDLGTGASGGESYDTGDILGLGGKALAIGLLEKYLDPQADPLGPGNILVIAPSPLASYMFPGSNRLGAFSKSPLTGAWLECYVGGSISRTLRETGWQALVIMGESSTPCHLHVDATGAALLPADGLWSRDTFETEAAILPSLDKRSSVLSIGPAGENLVAFASVMHEQAHALGRGGMGAVFGSKKLKALSVTSPGPARLEVSEVFASTRLAVTRLATESPVSNNYRRFGTPMMVAIMNEAGAFPTGFWESGRAAHRSSLEAEGWQEWAKVDTDTSSPVPCAAARS